MRHVWLIFVCVVCCNDLATGQRIRFPNPAPQPSGPLLPPPNTFAQNSGGPVAATPWVPVAPGQQGAVLGNQIQPFDPYSVPGGFGAPGTVNPQLPPVTGPPLSVPANPAGMLPPATVPTNQPPAAIPVFPSGAPNQLPPPNFPPAYQPPVLPPGYQQPPPLNGPIAPEPVFPNGFQWGDGRIERFLQDTGVLYTYLYGNDGDELQMHEVEIFTSMLFKNFMHSPSGLRVTPGFAFHFLDGPAVPGRIDLPATLYSAYLNALWQPQLTPQFGADLNLRVGVYSDFDTVNTDSIRVLGRGLGVLQLTPTTAFKLGVEYLDRVKVKVLPAGGLYWEPDPQTRVDLYFPRPRISRYWTTYGNTEIWWHIGAEYGGGAWTIDRIDTGLSQQIDINDIRIFWGIDWNRLDRVDGIVEIGYVFDREIVVRGVPAENVSLDDTFMFRAGMKF